MADAPPNIDLHRLLKAAVDSGASDVHLKPGKPPVFRVNGALHVLTKHPPLTAQDMSAIARLVLDDRQIERYKQNHQIDLAYSVTGLGRFRLNVYQQRGTLAFAFRVIPYKVQSFVELHMPPILEKICQERRGMVLVTGATGSGKSTTLAAMIDYINNLRTEHIITIEDPIEFLLRDKLSLISQREIGFDTEDFASALRSAMRQDPDVILVGEMRDLETINTALMAAETGHLVFSTLHTTDVMETINRVLSFYQAHQQDQVRHQMAAALKAIVCQRLIARADGKGRVPAVEVLVTNARVREAIREYKKTPDIPDIMRQSFTTYGMQSFDMSLISLVQQNLVTVEEALENATNRGDLALRMKGVSGSDEATYTEYKEGDQTKKKPGGGGGAGTGGAFDDLLERFSG